MKVGDYVAKISAPWKQHNRWMEFPCDPPATPLGVLVSWCNRRHLWTVLTSSGKLIQIEESTIEEIKL